MINALTIAAIFLGVISGWFLSRIMVTIISNVWLRLTSTNISSLSESELEDLFRSKFCRDDRDHDETEYLTRHPANRKRLEESIAQISAGQTIDRDIIEDDLDHDLPDDQS